MMNEFAVQVDHIEKIFGDFTAVNKISFKVRKGEIFGFLGPNGAGKSTTIRMLCGLLVPTSGTGSVAGFDIIKDGEKIKENIGYMSQKFSLYEDLTVEENIDFYSGIYKLPRSKKKDRKDWVLKMAGLEDHRKTRTSVLSGGWKQRLALGCAIIHEPPILFLDEPTAGVDPISRRQFWELIHGLSESGVTVFVTTHYMDEAEYCDRIALIYRGDLIALGTSGSLKTEFMKEDIIDIDCSLPQDAMGIIEGLKGIKEVALFGKGLHAVAEENVEKLVPRIKDLLGAHGYVVNRVEKIMPSLEDVFVSMIEAYDRSLEPQKGVSL